MSQPYFSICVPNFNYEKFIGITFDYILVQTFADFEIIVVDNASTDRSWEIIQNYASKDSRFKIFRNNYNVGFAPNLQRCGEKATGKYIIMLSSDDLIYKDALQEYYNITQKYDENLLIHSAYEYIDEHNTPFKISMNFAGANNNTDFNHKYYDVKGFDNSLLDGSLIKKTGFEVLKYSISTGVTPAAFLTTCFSKKLFDSVEGYDLKYISGPDVYFLYKILERNPAVIYVKKALFGYRIHNYNQTAIELKAGALKKQVDKYIFTFSVDKKVLSELGLTKDQVEKVFIKKFCLEESLRNLSYGGWSRALKLFFFSLATYPGVSASTGMFYINFILLALGPIGILIAKLGRSMRK